MQVKYLVQELCEKAVQRCKPGNLRCIFGICSDLLQLLVVTASHVLDLCFYARQSERSLASIRFTVHATLNTLIGRIACTPQIGSSVPQTRLTPVELHELDVALITETERQPLRTIGSHGGCECASVAQVEESRRASVCVRIRERERERGTVWQPLA